MNDKSVFTIVTMYDNSRKKKFIIESMTRYNKIVLEEFLKIAKYQRKQILYSFKLKEQKYFNKN